MQLSRASTPPNQVNRASWIRARSHARLCLVSGCTCPTLQQKHLASLAVNVPRCSCCWTNLVTCPNIGLANTSVLNNAPRQTAAGCPSTSALASALVTVTKKQESMNSKATAPPELAGKTLNALLSRSPSRRHAASSYTHHCLVRYVGSHTLTKVREPWRMRPKLKMPSRFSFSSSWQMQAVSRNTSVWFLQEKSITRAAAIAANMLTQPNSSVERAQSGGSSIAHAALVMEPTKALHNPL
mmetsp:Transcript_7164/g.18347  ORF Transcript_7164/g.18347 Transcript_7164/m.18347 type:complete len:241 (+) Transcript_7164:269-991(+)